MTQERFNRIESILTQYGSADDVAALQKLWKKYQQYQGAIMFTHQPTINVYYDKPKAMK